MNIIAEHATLFLALACVFGFFGLGVFAPPFVASDGL